MTQYTQSTDGNEQDIRDLTVEEMQIISGANATDYPIIHR
jgi:hypothetical protein